MHRQNHRVPSGSVYPAVLIHSSLESALSILSLNGLYRLKRAVVLEFDSLCSPSPSPVGGLMDSDSRERIIGNPLHSTADCLSIVSAAPSSGKAK